MRFARYIKYFFFLAFKWDVRIAWHMIKQEIKGEKKYGINTTGADELHKLEDQGIDISHAAIYMPVSYTLLETIFENLPAITGNHFLDMGSGKGRALCMAAHKGFKQVTGLDFSKDLCEQAKINLAVTRQKIPDLNYTIINNDAFYFEIPASVDCLFFFNPFDEMIMSGVVKNILKSLKQHPRKLSIIYVNPMHEELFLKAGFTETWYTRKREYLEASVLVHK